MHNGERSAAAREMLAKIGTTFEADEEAWLVMEGSPVVRRDLRFRAI